MKKITKKKMSEITKSNQSKNLMGHAMKFTVRNVLDRIFTQMLVKTFVTVNLFSSA